MYAIISGKLEVVDVLDDTDTNTLQGTKKLINTLIKGDVVGEMGMVRSCQRSATVIAAAPTELLQINDRMIKRLHWLYPPTAQKFFFNLMSIICDRLEYSTQCLLDVTTVDGLTGLNNRDYFMKLLGKEMDRANRYRTDLSVFIMDLDNFNSINLTYGHETGDQILSEVGLFIQKHVRKSDQACRYGGQQFAVILINSPSTQTQMVCERFRRLLPEYCFEAHSSPVFVTVSIGYVSLKQWRNTSPEAFMEMAYQALKQAKISGKNYVKEYTG
jgi:diguanylate cyclase (GGDEF)-like protein